MHYQVFKCLFLHASEKHDPGGMSGGVFYLIVLPFKILEAVLQTKLLDNPPPPSKQSGIACPQLRPLPLPHMVSLSVGHKASLKNTTYCTAMEEVSWYELYSQGLCGLVPGLPVHSSSAH